MVGIIKQDKCQVPHMSEHIQQEAGRRGAFQRVLTGVEEQEQLALPPRLGQPHPQAGEDLMLGIVNLQLRWVEVYQV